MKSSRRAIALFLTIVMIVNFLTLGAVQALAHETILNVEYDPCDREDQADGIDEKWYVLYTRRELFGNSKCYHISHETQTIKYYFADESPTGYRWDTDISAGLAEEIKACYANSMEKWNNVYFYSYDSNGNILKNKLINIVEGSSTDNNLIIYPYYTVNTTFASARYINEDSENVETLINERIEHTHVSKWTMNVNLYLFYLHDNIGDDYVNCARNKVGAHEIGHILGLRDIDDFDAIGCGAGTQDEHHEELLMGYGNIANSTSDITYKDIAGVAITRGFHTDADHKWLYQGQQSDDTYKLICSICNGVKYVESLSGYSYNTYNACNGNHTLSSGNMMAVASYGTSDYYKCKYCRYVAPFSNIVSQNYTSKIYRDDTYHTYTNTVAGLEYTVYEEHNIVDHRCTDCDTIIHSYTHLYSWDTNARHKCYCECGDFVYGAHVVSQGSFSGPITFAICLLCKGRAQVGQLNSISDNLPHTENGSYILQNGIIVLVDEDIDAYMEGTLIFYSGVIA